MFFIISGISLATLQIRLTKGHLTKSLSELTKGLDSIDKWSAIISGISFIAGLFLALAF